MYGKLYPQMYEGSLRAAGWEAIIALQQMVILANVEGVVDKTLDWIADTTTLPRDILERGIAVLEKPDPESRTPDEDGRRLVRLSDTRSWGWRIVNYAHYRNLRKEEERRDYHRQYWREVRSPKLKTQPDSTRTQQNSTHSTDAVSSKHRQREDAEGKDLKIPLRGSRRKAVAKNLNGDGRSITEMYDDDLPIPHSR